MITIGITGPECSGKSTLALFLATKLGVNWIPEHARSYLEKLNRTYNQEDLDLIARRQLMMIEAVEKSKSEYLIADTEMLVLKIWSQEKYGKVSGFIKSAYLNQDFDLIVLCKPDIPYEEDKFREHPHDRNRLFDLYLNELENSGNNFIVAEADLNSRVNKVLAAIKKI